MSAPAKYRLSFEAVESKWIVREWTMNSWQIVGMCDTLNEAEAKIAALAHPPAEREYDADGNLIGVRVLL